MTKHTPNLKAQKIVGGVRSSQRHDSAHKHVAGTAVYIDDITEPAGTLHVGLGLSTVAHGTLRSVDLSAVREAPGVVAVLTHVDVPGENDISPSNMHDDPVFADGRKLLILDLLRRRRDARTGPPRRAAGEDRV